MIKIDKWYYMDNTTTICPNYGGWVIVNGYDYNIYKRLKDAVNAYKKCKDGTNKEEPVVIGRMTDDEFIHALCENW